MASDPVIRTPREFVEASEINSSNRSFVRITSGTAFARVTHAHCDSFYSGGRATDRRLRAIAHLDGGHYDGMHSLVPDVLQPPLSLAINFKRVRFFVEGAAFNGIAYGSTVRLADPTTPWYFALTVAVPPGKPNPAAGPPPTAKPVLLISATHFGASDQLTSVVRSRTTPLL